MVKIRNAHRIDVAVDRRIILKWVLKEILCDGVKWIQLAHDTAQQPGS
jgi:hypothetical protein